METGIAFVLLFLAVITPDGELHGDLKPFLACPPQAEITAKLEADKAAGKIKDFYINCTVPLRPVEQRGAEGESL